MSERALQLGKQWLLNRASELSVAATDAAEAYNPDSPLGKVCSQVAEAYEKASEILMSAAEELHL